MIEPLAKQYLLAKERFDRAVRIKIRTADVMQDKPLFWEIIDSFQLILKQHIFKRDDAVGYSAKEFVCQWWMKGNNGFDFEDLPSFIRTYARLKESLAAKVVGIPEDKVSDIIDALPLAGKDVCLLLLSSTADCFDTVRTSCTKEIAELILHKDNFTEQALEQAYGERLAEDVIYQDKDFALDLENADP